MPCKSCLVDCDKRINRVQPKLTLNSNLVLVDCPCRNCLVRIMCSQTCLRESAWVLEALAKSCTTDIPPSDSLDRLRKIYGV